MEYDEHEHEHEYDLMIMAMSNSPPIPERPSKIAPVSDETHKQWLKKRKEKGNKRFDKKTKALIKRIGSD